MLLMRCRVSPIIPMAGGVCMSIVNITLRSMSVIFDKDGHHWRTFFFSFGHPEFNSHSRGIRVPMFVGNSWVDYKAERATIWIPSRNIYNRPLPVHSFTVGAMMRQGK